MKQKRIMILGGGSSQISLLRRCVDLGHFVILADMNPQCPGRELCHSFAEASTFDWHEVYRAAEKENIDGITTMGTDQPVLTCARVAEKLSIPSFLDAATAAAVTNKGIMKNRLKEMDFPTPPFRLLHKYFTDNDLEGMSFPVVIKPQDSQGQRGIFYVTAINEIRKNFDEVLRFSRENEILAEEYYPSTEITVSGWIVEGKTNIYSITDRVTFDQKPHIGICAAHRYPSMHVKKHRKEIGEFTSALVREFGIQNGPIYFQMLLGEKGLMTNELACRLGGAYEDEFIPRICGVPILDLLIKGALGECISQDDAVPKTGKGFTPYVTVPLLFADECRIRSYPDTRQIRALPGVVNVSFLQSPGTVISEMVNSTQRIGYCIIEGKTGKEINLRTKEVFSHLKIYSEKGSQCLKDSLLYCLHPEKENQ